MWYKTRFMDSSGCSKWKYIYVNDAEISKDEMDSMMERACNAPTWSEHYRKTEYMKVKIENVPREVVEKIIESKKFELDCAKSFLKFYTEEAKKCKVFEVKVKCKRCKGKRKIVARNCVGGFMECFCKDGTQKEYEN